MEDNFYEEYAKALNENNAGKYTWRQSIVCWVMLYVMVVFGVLLFAFANIKDKTGVEICAVGYLGVGFLLHFLMNGFDKMRTKSLLVNALTERKDALKKTINKFFGIGHYDEKIDFLVSLYEKAFKQREEREKLVRKIGAVVVSVVGTVVVNTLNHPDSISWKVLFSVVITGLIIFGLAIGPLYYRAAFDSKKKEYYFMVVELQTVKLIMHSKIEGTNHQSPKVKDNGIYKTRQNNRPRAQKKQL